MNRFILSGIVWAMLAHSSAASSQLVQDTVEGTHRVCRYGQATGFSSGGERQQTLRVGMWANCPTTYSERVNIGPAPPTAMLYAQTTEGQVRRCVYEQLGYVWTRSVPLQSYCPVAAGMVREESRQPAPRRGRTAAAPPR